MSRPSRMILLVSCVFLAVTAAAAVELPSRIGLAIADPERPADDRALDDSRHVAEVLAFADIRPGNKVVDLMPGKGYYTRLFSKLAGPDGKVYALQPAEMDKVAPKGLQSLRSFAGMPAYANVVVLVQPVSAMSVPEKVDVIWTSQNYHDLHDPFMGSPDIAKVDAALFNALKPHGTLIVLDPSGEVAPMVAGRRRMLGHEVYVLDPKHPTTGFNVLDWIGRFGDTKEQDIAAIAAWLVPDRAQTGSGRDDFFRSSALQLLTSLIADVCLSDREGNEQTLRQVRANLAEPEQKLRGRLKEIYESSSSAFLRQNVAAFVEMTPETFSGVHANAIKETHWLSYPNYAAMISASSFSTDEIATGAIDVFITIDLKTLENHAGLARVVIGSLLNAIYNRHGAFRERTLFLLDEAARLGYMRILETARDVGRKYGITLMMLFQSIGQMRESYGGREAASKWFESASWISFAAINDPETADYISQRCGMTTVETD